MPTVVGALLMTASPYWKLKLLTMPVIALPSDHFGDMCVFAEIAYFKQLIISK